MRTYAFLGRQRWLGISLVLMLLGETGFLLFVSAGHVMQNILPVVTRGPCTGTDYPGQHLVSGIYLAPVVFDFICTALSLWQVCNIFSLAVLSVTECRAYVSRSRHCIPAARAS